MKNFEKEYREMIQEEMPDLWGRIEAGLVEKGQPEQKQEQKEKKKGNINRRWVKYSGWAAACLCGVIVLPAIVMTMRNGGSKATGEAYADAALEEMETEREAWNEAYAEGAAESEAVMETSEEEAAEMAASEAPAEEVGDMTVEGEVAKEIGNMTATKEATKAVGNITATEEATKEVADMTTMGVPTEEAAGTAMKEAEDTDSKTSTGAISQMSGGSENGLMSDAVTSTALLEDGTCIENLRVRITAVEPLNYHTVYRGVVERDESGAFRLQETVEFLAITGQEEQLAVGEVYEVTLEYDAASDISLHLKRQETN